ncbi:hypothetical protein HK104_008810 [Borealophlyctis nickersoniae]|nr:hypothetical protein HK104_008810 [Borealophlyctis nickersoniae]
MFNASKPTPNSRIILYQARTGKMLVASINGTSFKNLLTGERYPIQDAPDAAIVEVGKALQALYGNVTAVPVNSEEVLMANYDMNGEPWFICTRYFSTPPFNWVLVVAIPRKDFFSRIDTAQKTAIIVAVAVAVVGAVVVSLAAFAALRPLHSLASSMKQLTMFDFSSLEGGILDNRSLILEIRHLQETFSSMVSAFSVSIKKDRSLMTGASGSQSTGR